MTTCSKCHKDILFVRIQPAGQEERSIPLDAEQVTVTKPGAFIVIENGKAVFKKLSPGQKGYVSHFANCPYAAVFRRKKKIEKVKKEKLRVYMLNDMSGLIKLLSDAKSLTGLKNEWESEDFRIAKRKLSEEDQKTVTDWKDRCKEKFTVSHETLF